MGRAALRPSNVIASLLRSRREELGLSLRDVEERCSQGGERIHFATLARVEQGKVEIGINRLHKLFKVYDLPLALAQDLLELEGLKGATPAPMPLESLGVKGVEYWKSGDLKRGIAHLFALRTRSTGSGTERVARQRALLSMAVAAGSLGRLELSKYVLEGLLVEPPDPGILASVLAQLALCWQGLGSTESALAYLDRAEAHVGRKDHAQRAWVLHEKALLLTDMGDIEGSEAAQRQAISAYRKARDPYGAERAAGVRLKALARREDWGSLLEEARSAKRRAQRHGYRRLFAARSIDEARALLGQGTPQKALGPLRDALAWAIQEDDRLVRFYAHYYLWKAYEAEGDTARAEAERRSAEEHVGFVDEVTPETREFRPLEAP
jgi:tetratricopeptide (TPR) repeat protein